MSKPRLVSYAAPKPADFEVVNDGILDLAIRHRRIGESPFETAHRLLVNEALARCGGIQTDAAAILRISTRVMNYYCRDLQLRPKDRLCS